MRKATPEELSVIWESMLHLKKVSPAPWMTITHEPTAYAYIEQAIDDGRVWFFGAYMVMVDVGCPWFTNKRCLLEEIVLKVHRDDKTFNIQTVISAGLDQLASHYGCEATVVGDTQIGMLTPLYERAGFTTIGTQLYKCHTKT